MWGGRLGGVGGWMGGCVGGGGDASGPGGLEIRFLLLLPVLFFLLLFLLFCLLSRDKTARGPTDSRESMHMIHGRNKK